MVPDRVATDGAGNIYVFGPAASESPAFGLIKYTSSGAVIWSQGFGTGSPFFPANFLEARFSGMAVDSSGNVTIAADFTGTLTFADVDGGPTSIGVLDSGTQAAVFVASFDPSGDPRWAHAVVLASDPNLTVTTASPDVALGANGDVVLGGTYWSTIDLGSGPLSPTGTNLGDRDVFLADYNASGRLAWAKSYGAAGANTLINLAGDGTGFVALAGTFTSDLTFGATVLKPSAPDGQATSTAFVALLQSP
jgi:hypothetical protein